MYKKLYSYLAGLAVLILVYACGARKEENHDHKDHQASTTTDEWQGMDEFHFVMAESFHPYKDSANLEPAKVQAEEMAAIAEKWAQTPLPEKVNNAEVKSKLQELKTNTAAFVETVKTENDEVIGEGLTQLHDLFHELQESWYEAEDHHH
jgi:hypothetical protein